jgi:hypothetical protein
MCKARQTFECLIAQWGKLCVAYTPAALQLFNDKLAIKQQIDLTCAEFRSEVNRRHHSTPLCNVICGCADCCRDRGNGRGIWIIRSGQRGVIQCNAN